MKNHILAVIGVLSVSLLGVSACDKIVHEPTKLTEKRVQVVEEKVFEEVRVSDMDDDAVAALSQHYARSGNGALDLSVTYDPRSRSATAMNASSEVARIAALFRENGVAVNSANILPVNGQGDDMQALVSYGSVEALAPEDCDLMPGMTDRNIEAEAEYELGCSLETVFAKQIARPKDLTGRKATLGDSDGRRTSNVVEVYRTGVPNESLAGETATGN